MCDSKPYTTAIITTTPNELVGQVHDRMPVIVPPEMHDLWIDRGVTDPSVLQPLLAPYPAGLMEKVAVGRYVSNVRNQGPDCLKPSENRSVSLFE